MTAAVRERPDVERVVTVADGPGRDADDVRRLLAAARETVGEDGVAVFVEAIRGETDGAALAALEVVAQAGSGGAYDAATLEAWLDAAGFAGAVTEIPGLADRAVVGRAID